jgi:pimeloyl-ACP methyl ester carboxylesterase
MLSGLRRRAAARLSGSRARARWLADGAPSDAVSAPPVSPDTQSGRNGALFGVLGVLAAVVAFAPAASADASAVHGLAGCGGGFAWCTYGLRAGVRLQVAARSGGLPASATVAAVQDVCPPEAAALGAVCGHVEVPLDRRHPNGATIPIAFELYLHTGSGPATSPIVPNFGGPGLSTTAAPLREAAFELFGADLDTHDLLLVDDRGRGSSAAIDCPDLQHGTATILTASLECGEQLGPAASRYGTGDIAQDLDAVRAALGYQKLDLFGSSYGGADAAAYATRYAAHVRSIVLDDPFGTPDRELFSRDKTRIAADGRSIHSTCELAPACAADLPDPNAPVDWVVRSLRAAPLTGQSLDADGNLHQLTIDPQWFLVHLYDNVGGPFLVFGQLPAASEALREHDPVPLLRLAADNDFPVPGDEGEPTFFSVGAHVATFCADNLFPWSQQAPLALRQDQWSDAVALQDNEPYAPFSASEVLRSEFDNDWPDHCLPWPALDHPSPIVEPGADYPVVPTIVLDGAQDQIIPLPVASQVARLFHAPLVTVQGAAHTATGYSPCAASIAAAWIETPGHADTGCAGEPFIIPPDTPRFELTASQADLPTALPGNSAPPADLRVARAAADALNDALKQGLMSETGNSPGLRGGSVATEFGAVWKSTLNGYRFAIDTAVSGTSTWNGSSWWTRGGDGQLSADLTVDGPDHRDGTLHVSGTFFAPGPPGKLHLTGSIGGKIVNATIPAD